LKSKVYLIGASGHGKVICNNLLLSGQEVEAFLDDNPGIVKLQNLLVISPVSASLQMQGDYIISIGNNNIRKQIAENHQLSYITAVHPQSTIDQSSSIKEGTVVMAGVVINASVKIGKHTIINTAASIDHDCEIGDYAHISPNATLSGNVTVGEGTHIGAGAVVIPGIKIGKWATVGAGSVIIRDVPDYAVVVGNPGTVKKIEGE